VGSRHIIWTIDILYSSFLYSHKYGMSSAGAQNTFDHHL
jgi:hypothetical protein